MATQKADIGDRNGGSWGTVSRGRKYFTVEVHSRYQGTRTDTVVKVPLDAPGLGVERTDDLEADYNPGVSNAERVQWYSSAYQDRCVVARRGEIVQ